jgi:uncharacterized protein involved in exopolysaccharide biosynthesis
MKAGDARVWGLTVLAVGLLLCATGSWQLAAPTRYRAATKFRVEPESSAADGQSSSPGHGYAFVQTEIEAIRSATILGKVVESLHLDEEWGKQSAGGERLNNAEAISILKRCMEVRSINGTPVVEVRAVSDKPEEAAMIANATADAYLNFKQRQRDQSNARVVDELESQFKDYEEKTRTAQKMAEQLKKDSNVPNPEPDEDTLRSRYPLYWKAMQTLAAVERAKAEWMSQISSNRVDQLAPGQGMVTILDPAFPPRLPVSPDRPLGIAMLAAGLVAVLCGVFLMSARKKPEVSPGGTSP